MEMTKEILPLATLVLCCGKVCSGKSTFAASLQESHGYCHFSVDQWMLHFYGEVPERKAFEANLMKCKEMIYALSETLLMKNINVILDFGYWTLAERRATVERFTALGHKVSVVYFAVSLDQQLQYLAARMTEKPNGNYGFNKEAVIEFNRLFQEPGSEEAVMTKQEFWLSLGAKENP